MTFIRAFVRYGLLALSCAGMANADIIDQPRFDVPGLVIVWGAESGTSPQISDRFQAKAGRAVQARADLPVAFGSGRLVPISGPLEKNTAETDAAYAASRFFVASNTAFSIDAELEAADPQPLDRISFDFSVSLSGGRAQYPHSAGPDGGMDKSVKTLGDLEQRTTVFRGNRRTAARRGTIRDQSVRFDAELISRIPHLETSRLPDIIFTVYVP
ncbi:MAG: hypothetical protein AAGK23_02795 [Pseudomonadota bacterium]